MNLCCQINGTLRCKHCSKKACSDHIFTKSWLTSRPLAELPVCVNCYKDLRAANIPKDIREGMTFKELFLAARELCPKGYLSVTVCMDDHNPALEAPGLTWNVYSADYGHNNGVTPEAALQVFKAKVEGISTAEQVDV